MGHYGSFLRKEKDGRPLQQTKPTTSSPWWGRWRTSKFRGNGKENSIPRSSFTTSGVRWHVSKPFSRWHGQILTFDIKGQSLNRALDGRGAGFSFAQPPPLTRRLNIACGSYPLRHKCLVTLIASLERVFHLLSGKGFLVGARDEERFGSFENPLEPRTLEIFRIHFAPVTCYGYTALNSHEFVGRKAQKAC